MDSSGDIKILAGSSNTSIGGDVFVQSGNGEMGGRILLTSGEGNIGSGGDVDIFSATSASSLDGRYVVMKHFCGGF